MSTQTFAPYRRNLNNRNEDSLTSATFKKTRHQIQQGDFKARVEKAAILKKLKAAGPQPDPEQLSRMQKLAQKYRKSKKIDIFESNDKPSFTRFKKKADKKDVEVSNGLITFEKAMKQRLQNELEIREKKLEAIMEKVAENDRPQNHKTLEKRIQLKGKRERLITLQPTIVEEPIIAEPIVYCDYKEQKLEILAQIKSLQSQIDLATEKITLYYENKNSTDGPTWKNVLIQIAKLQKEMEYHQHQIVQCREKLVYYRDLAVRARHACC